MRIRTGIAAIALAAMAVLGGAGMAAADDGNQANGGGVLSNLLNNLSLLNNDVNT
ncbi:hypothetical protein [Streptomyces sp. ODS28]|uniref:hypothetical protein n=1 Tax=Streptomyces sp. ODS28 TaxID=3136688 RepID=UPI0031EA1225